MPTAPEALPAPQNLTEFELCITVLASSMRHVLAQYNSAHGTTFACDLVSLTRLFKRVVEQVQTNHNLLNQYKSIASGKARASDGGKGGRIPKKAHFADRETRIRARSLARTAIRNESVTTSRSGSLRSSTLT